MNKYIESTHRWLKEVVVGKNLCPFAKAPLENKSIEIVSCPNSNLIDTFANELEKLNEGKFETTLIVLEDKSTFEEFYNNFTSLEDMLEDNGLDQHFQLVAFHPKFVFQGLKPDDLANFVNRSPYPTVHILKRSSFDQLDLNENTGEEISFANERLLKSLPKEEFQRLFPWAKP
tara:strand:- start:100051 stop:100572 length:522 start_codon:yes stop_codon:yes gene_type:complete